jgi:E2F/DP family winged-helix DNA-binding domain
LKLNGQYKNHEQEEVNLLQSAINSIDLNAKGLH